MKRTLLTVLPLIAAMVLVSTALVGGHATQVIAATEDRSTLDNLIVGTGRVEPLSEEINVTSQLPGKIKYVRAQEGAKVQKGQILAILEFDDSMARCASAETELQQKRDALRTARDQDRVAAQSAVAQALAKVEAARAEWDKHFLRAPVSGVVLRKNVRNGETVRDTPVVAIAASASTLRVRMDIDETNAGRIHVGQSAYVTAESFPGKKFNGHVVQVDQKPLLQTVIALDPGAPLQAGTRVDAFLTK